MPFRAFAAALLLALGVWVAAPSGQQRAAESGAPFVDGEVLVKFRPGVTPVRRDAAVARIRGQRIRRFASLNQDHLRLPRGRRVEDAVAELQADPDVEAAQPNYIRKTTALPPPDDPFWLDDSLWGMQKIQAQEAWTNYGTGGGTVVVADIDTGVVYTHPELAANTWINPGEIPGNDIDDDLNGYIDDVHGINVLTHSGDPLSRWDTSGRNTRRSTRRRHGRSTSCSARRRG